MKRILLLLALILTIGVNAQIVGGYLPVNSSKSFTAGNATFSNVIARGTMSVAGSSTFNNIVIPSQSLATGVSIMTDQTGNQYPFIVSGGSLNANAIMTGSANSRYELVNSTTAVRWYLSNNTATTGIGLDGISLGINANPNSGFLKMTSAGITTITGATSLGGGGTVVTGNTGTVAVMNDAIWTINCMHNNSNPGDGTTVYYGVPVIGLPSSTATHYTMSVPKNSTLIGYEMVGYINGTPGSAETASVYVRVNNTTDITLSTAITFSAGSGFQQFSSQALNTNVSAGDYFNIKVIHPTYVTNPTSLSEGVILKFKLR